MSRKIINTILFLILVSLSFIAIRYAINKQEIYECQKWKLMAEQYSGFYLTEWQKEQCDYHHITIDAPVKVGGRKTAKNQ